MKIKLLAVQFATLCSCILSSAGEFKNLNFDEGGNPLPPFDQPQSVGLVLPGWTARMGDQVLSQIAWNSEGITYGRVSVTPPASRPNVLEGRYGMLLQGGPDFSDSSPNLAASVSQLA